MKSFSKVSIVCEGNITVRYLYYCEFAWKFKNVKISENIDFQFSKVIILDRDSLHKIKITQKLREYKIIVCFWNGMFDLEEPKIKFYLAKFNKLKIKINYFFVGYFKEYEHNKRYLFSKDEFIRNKSCSVDCKFKYKFAYKFSTIYYLIRAIKFPKSFARYYFQKKVIFYGTGILNDDSLKIFKEGNSSQIFKTLKDFYKVFYINNQSESGRKFLINLIYKKKFKTLEPYKKLYIFQTLSRSIILRNLINYKNFQYIPREYKMGLVRCGIYKNNIYLDFGSKCGLEKIYDRSLLLNRNHEKNSYKIDFFRKKSDFKLALKRFLKLNNVLEKNSDKKINASQLLSLIKHNM